MDYEQMNDEYIAPTYGSRQLTLVRGEGVYLYDAAGKRYIDCFSNYGVNILGYNVREINDAVCSQMKLLTNMHGSFSNDKRSIFAKMLVEKSPQNLRKVFFCNSGTETIEAAIKFARLSTGRAEIIAANMGYHGKTMGALSLTKTLPKYNEPFLPLLENVKHFSYGDSHSLREIISSKTAAVFLEPIQGEGGIRIPPEGFFTEVRSICDEHGALLVIDEIQTFARTGRLFAIEHFKVQPDIMCLAKGLAGGLPIGAVLITESISEKLFSGCHTNTFGGNPLVCAAGIAAFDYIQKNSLEKNAEQVGNYFMEKLRQINSPVIREVRGRGMMIAIELKTRITKYTRELQERGVIVIPTGPNVLRLLPPIVFSRENADDATKIIDDCLS